MYRIEVKRSREVPKDVKLSALLNGYLRFLIFVDFDPKTQNFEKKNREEDLRKECHQQILHPK